MSYLDLYTLTRQPISPAGPFTQKQHIMMVLILIAVICASNGCFLESGPADFYWSSSTD